MNRLFLKHGVAILFWLVHLNSQAQSSKTSHIRTVEPATIREWAFPIKRPHAGIPMGNGKQGILVWGHHDTLKITISRQGFWDHQGGRDFTDGGTYKQLEKLVQAKDEASLRSLFGPKASQSIKSFQQLGGGRLTVILHQDKRLFRAKLDKYGSLAVQVVDSKGVISELTLKHSQIDDCLLIDAPVGVIADEQLASAGKFCQHAYAQRGIPTADSLNLKVGQALVKVAYQGLPLNSGLVITAAKSTTKRGIQYQLSTRLVARGSSDWKNYKPALVSESPKLERSLSEWSRYYATVPTLKLASYQGLVKEYNYGLYIQAIAQSTTGLPSTLQGPLLEDNNLPPWSADYHWNINVQMLHWSNLITGQPERQKPLWDFIRLQLPTMQRYGRHFFGKEGAIMLPHATDDRLKITGSFWAGHIDAACMAWLAQMAYEYYQYTLDDEHLKQVVWPLANGAMISYRAMLSDTVIGGKPTYWLPVSVNPEWRGSQLRAAGPNASFQIAAIHALLKFLPSVAEKVNESVNPEWKVIQQRLPVYTVINAPFSVEYDHFNWNRIALFTNQDLIESHRHHSHLAAIYPFKTVVTDDTTGKNDVIIKNSLVHWLRKGPGTWTGWSHIWASLVCSYAQMPHAALFWLNQWQQGFLNEGGGSLHDAPFEGISVAYRDDAYKNNEAGKPYREYMQLDARLGYLKALLEVFIRVRADHKVLIDLNPFKRSQLTNTSESVERVHLPHKATVSIFVKHPNQKKAQLSIVCSGQLPVSQTTEVIVKGWPKNQTAVLKIDRSRQVFKANESNELCFTLPARMGGQVTWSLEQ